MGHINVPQKPHAVIIPYPSQGHITPMLNLAKLLHQKGFHITFINSEYNHKRLLKARGPDSLNGVASFQFCSIPDGLPPTEADATQDIPSLSQSTSQNCLGPLKDLLKNINESSSNIRPVSCMIADGIMGFSVDAAYELGIPVVLFWTTSACGFLAYLHFRHLVDKGLTPLKDKSFLTNGYLDTVIDWIPGMKGIRLRDMPSFVRTTDAQDFMFNFHMSSTERATKVNAVILNTFEELEHQVLASLSTLLPAVYSIGPLHLMLNKIKDDQLKLIGSSLWKEEPQCLNWLDSKEPNSVVYVNFGSITVVTSDQLIEFAWGLANSKKNFLWVIRPDLVAGDKAILPPEFVSETKDRGFLASWCPQEQVLNHPSIGGFLTHSGWNSTLESLCCGVPMICWPFFSEQPTNCWFSCTEWGVGMEINSDVKRDEVERLVIELMEGKKGKEMKKKALEWKRLAAEAAEVSSCQNLDKLINDVLLSSK